MGEFFENDKQQQLVKYEIEKLDKQKHELKFIGRQRKVPGHTLFSFNIKTGEIKKAPTERSKVIDFKTMEPLFHERIVVEPDCIYRQALNKKNFIKRLLREGIIVKKAV